MLMYDKSTIILDIMEMMLVQNAQLQQMMMHQALMNNDPGVNILALDT